MPSTWQEWIWFTFFAGGALGGWMITGMFVIEFVRKVRR